MMGKNHRGALLVMTDRAELHTSLHLLRSRHSAVVSKAIINKLYMVKYPHHTITFDNDRGFADHIAVADAPNINTYFTKTYTIQDKGTVEYRIGKL
jgi:IS30 family transposase